MRFSIFLITLLNVCFASAQVSGVVVDNQTKKPIPYANIWFAGTYTGTYANEKGEFFLSETAGDSLIISSMGYEVQTMLLSASNIEKLRIKLTPSPIQLSEVVVSSKSKGVRMQKIGYNKGKTADKLFSVIRQDYRQSFRVDMRTEESTSLGAIGIGLDPTADLDGLVVSVLIRDAKGWLTEEPFIAKVTDTTNYPLLLPTPSIRVDPGAVQVYISLLGFEKEGDQYLRPGTVPIRFARTTTDTQRTYMRRSEEVDWSESEAFFRSKNKYSNLNVWLEVYE